jgi:hypothetical protein
VPARAGANRFVWNLRYERPTTLETGKPPDPDAEEQLSGTAPWALPGTYQVRLTVGDTAHTESFAILKDPRRPATDQELAAQFALKLAIRDRLSAVHEALNRIRSIRKQLEAWEQRAGADKADKADKAGSAGTARVAEAAAALSKRLQALEGELTNLDADTPRLGSAKLREKLMSLSGMIDESDDAPTHGATAVFAQLDEQVTAATVKLRRLLADDVAAFNEQVRVAELPAIGV